MSLETEYRAEQARIARQASERLAGVFPALNFRDLDGSGPGWVVAATAIATDMRNQSIGVAQDMYLTLRRQTGVRGQVNFILPDGADGKLRVSLMLEGPYAAKHALAAGGRIPVVAETTFARTTGKALKFGLDGGREFTTSTTRQDRRAWGWKRIARAGACGFCRALADKGAVYREDTAHFASHTNCGCACVPVFGVGDVGPEADVMQYMASGKTRTAKDRERLRDWIAAYE